jgi:hypothetical protein
MAQELTQELAQEFTQELVPASKKRKRYAEKAPRYSNQDIKGETKKSYSSESNSDSETDIDTDVDTEELELKYKKLENELDFESFNCNLQDQKLDQSLLLQELSRRKIVTSQKIARLNEYGKRINKQLSKLKKQKKLTTQCHQLMEKNKVYIAQDISQFSDFMRGDKPLDGLTLESYTFSFTDDNYNMKFNLSGNIKLQVFEHLKNKLNIVPTKISSIASKQSFKIKPNKEVTVYYLYCSQ